MHSLIRSLVLFSSVSYIYIELFDLSISHSPRSSHSEDISGNISRTLITTGSVRLLWPFSCLENLIRCVSEPASSATLTCFSDNICLIRIDMSELLFTILWIYFCGGGVGGDGRKIEMMRMRIRRRGWIMKNGWSFSAALFRIMRFEGRGAFALNRNEERLSLIRSVR